MPHLVVLLMVQLVTNYSGLLSHIVHDQMSYVMSKFVVALAEIYIYIYLSTLATCCPKANYAVRVYFGRGYSVHERNILNTYCLICLCNLWGWFYFLMNFCMRSLPDKDQKPGSTPMNLIHASKSNIIKISSYLYLCLSCRICLEWIKLH